MKFLNLAIIATLAASVAQANPEVSHSKDYRCKVVEYVSEKEATTTTLANVHVATNGEHDPVPARGFTTGKGSNAVTWAITRYNGLISVEVRNSRGEVVSISTSADGQAIGVKVPATKNILSCNPPKLLAAHLDINPQTYGESVTISPVSYGSTIQIVKSTWGSLNGADRRQILNKMQEKYKSKYGDNKNSAEGTK